MATLLDFIGNTPLVELQHINKKPNVKLLAKLEGHNPGGSVKDRAAYGLIKGAIDRGELKPGMKLIEATSGNTGIALAMIARLMNVEIELVMPENSTRERVLTMKAFGCRAHDHGEWDGGYVFCRNLHGDVHGAGCGGEFGRAGDEDGECGPRPGGG